MTEDKDRVETNREVADDLIGVYTTELLLREEIALLEMELEEVRAMLRKARLLN